MIKRQEYLILNLADFGLHYGELEIVAFHSWLVTAATRSPHE